MHVVAVRIGLLIGDILCTLETVVGVLKVDIAVLRPLIGKVEVAIQVLRSCIFEGINTTGILDIK